MAFNTARTSVVRGRPPGCAAGRRGASSSHAEFVKSVAYWLFGIISQVCPSLSLNLKSRSEPSQTPSKSLALLGLCGMFFQAVPAKASVVLVFNQALSSRNTFVYDFNFATAMNAGPPPASTDRLDNGTAGTIRSFATLYDIGGFVSAFSGSPNIMVTSQTTGITPSGTVPPDGPLTNVTLSYIGPSGVTVDTSYLGAVVVNSAITTTSLGYFTGADTKNAGVGAGTEAANIGRVAIPTTAAIPEPASLSMFAGGAALLLGGWVRRKKK